MDRARSIFNRVLPKSDLGKSFVLSVGIMGLAYFQMYGFTTSKTKTGHGLFDTERPEAIQASMDERDKINRMKLKDKVSNADKL
jgi:hypothetical protein